MIGKSIKELHEELVSKKITSEKLVKESIKACHNIQEKTNSFVTIIDEEKGSEVTDDLLSGIPYGIKDIFSTKDILSTGSSNTLNNYVPTNEKKIEEEEVEQIFDEIKKNDETKEQN